MDRQQYTSLVEALALVPDPRKARGKRYPWLLTLLAAGLASGQQTARAIAQWVRLHADELRAALPLLIRLPSESTLLRTLRLIDVALLERAIAQLNAPQTAADAASSHIITPLGGRLQAQALDGKLVRGTTACGVPTLLVSWLLTAVERPWPRWRSRASAMNSAPCRTCCTDATCAIPSPPWMPSIPNAPWHCNSTARAATLS